MRTLTNDCARCAGVRTEDGGIAEPCNTCLRQLAPANPGAIWVSNMAPPMKDGKCDYYWRAKE